MIKNASFEIYMNVYFDSKYKLQKALNSKKVHLMPMDSNLKFKFQMSFECRRAHGYRFPHSEIFIYRVGWASIGDWASINIHGLFDGLLLETGLLKETGILLEQIRYF